MQNPFEMLFGGKEQPTNDDSSADDGEVRSKRAQIAIDLRNGKLENEWVTVEVTEQNPSILMRYKELGWICLRMVVCRICSLV